MSVETDAAAQLAQRVLAAEGIGDGELGIAFVASDEASAITGASLSVDCGLGIRFAT